MIYRLTLKALADNESAILGTDTKGRNPHKRTSWKLVGNPGHELVTN